MIKALIATVMVASVIGLITISCDKEKPVNEKKLINKKTVVKKKIDKKILKKLGYKLNKDKSDTVSVKKQVKK